VQETGIAIVENEKNSNGLAGEEELGGYKWKNPKIQKKAIS
jgi:hypothetical protein